MNELLEVPEHIYIYIYIYKMLNKVFYKKYVDNTLKNLNIAQLINTIQYTINDFSKKK